MEQEKYSLESIISKARQGESWRDAMNSLLPEPYIKMTLGDRLWYWLHFRRAPRWKPNPRFHFPDFYGDIWDMPKFRSLR